ncbi:hypothetical protein [Microbacterium karelineae]|uniref:hypothetical protein n=1 Tax=Microbacterium karelineae TaxID=2654283 RepID=UPI0012EA85B3|nr:hypothetical protein [Microbacterium karelineae]
MDIISSPRSSAAPTRSAPRGLLWAGAGLGIAMLAAGLVWLVAPELGPFTRRAVVLQVLLGEPGAGPLIAAATQAALGAVTTALAVAALFSRQRAGTALAAGGLACGTATALGFVGFNGIVLAGYLLAMTAPIAIAAAAVVFALRRPRTGWIVLVIVAVLGAVAIAGPAPVGLFYARALEGVAELGVMMAAALLWIAFAGVWLLCGILAVAGDVGRFGRFVRRRRVAITIVAACCAVPYVIARASWLTPWPLFGGEAVADGGPAVLITGLMLASAMLVGGILTLGLILPWGARFPRWVPRVGGRPIPIALAVVPASIVAALFTAGGAESLVTTMAHGASVGDLLLSLVLPFWLWGPLLALATWGYAQHRAAERAAAG